MTDLKALVEKWRKEANGSHSCVSHRHLMCYGCALLKAAHELESTLSAPGEPVAKLTWLGDGTPMWTTYPEAMEALRWRDVELVVAPTEAGSGTRGSPQCPVCGGLTSNFNSLCGSCAMRDEFRKE